jgi:hypothetical protein
LPVDELAESCRAGGMAGGLVAAMNPSTAGMLPAPPLPLFR